MGDVFVTLLPVIAGATLVPVYPIVVLLLLQSQRGLGKALAFVTGAVAVRLVQGILFGFVFGAAAEAYPDGGSEAIASTLLLIVGILLLIGAYKKWRKEADPDEPTPQWMATIGGLSGLKAVGTGALFLAVSVKQWVFTLAAIDVILGAGLGTTTSIAAYLLYTAATQVLVLLPILLVAVAPQGSAQPLTAAQLWLERNNRVILVTASLVFGLWFFYKGISGLMG